MMRFLQISLLVVFLIILMPGISLSGECLQSDEDMYRDMAEGYKAAINGDEYSGGGWRPSRCWDGEDNSLNKKLQELSIEIIKDSRSKTYQKFEATKMLYRFNVSFKDKDLSKNTEEVLNHYVHNSANGWPDALRMLDREFDSYKSFLALYNNPKNIRNKSLMLYIVSERPKINDKRWISFLKEQAIVETNEKLKRALIDSVRKFAQLSTPQFVDYLVSNDLANDMRSLINEKSDLESLVYVFEKFDLIKAPNKNLSVEEIKNHFKWSSSIYKVLRKNLDQVFPEYLLHRLRPQDLRLLRNGIFAFYGKNFRSKELQYYYYGSVANVKYFCKKSRCGSRDLRKMKFNPNSLGEVDKQNITSISEAEKIVKETNYDFDQYIENYDLGKFLTEQADNFTLSSSKIRDIFQVKLDWKRKHVWLWDKNGVSGWDLKKGKRFHYAKSALGPIGLAKNKGLISYQQDGKLVVKSIDSNKTIYSAEIAERNRQYPNQTLNIFSPDNRFFVYCNEGKVFIVDTENWEQKAANIPSVSIWDSSLDDNKFYIRPYEFTPDGENLTLFTKQYRALGLVVVPLSNPEDAKLLNYLYREAGPGQILALAMDDNGKYLYVDEGFKSQILGFSVENILEDNSLDAPEKKLNPGKADYRYVKSIYVHNGNLIRVQSGSFGYLDIEDNDSNAKTERMDEGIPDFDFEAGVYAAGKWQGYIVIRRLPF